MSIIYSYPEQGALNANDMLIGTSAEKVGGKQKNITRNFTVQQIADFINRGAGFVDPVASDFQIPVFNQEGKKITGSIMSQNIYPNGSAITISGSLTVTNGATIGDFTNDIILQSPTALIGPIKDANSALSAGNQILLSTPSGNVVWQNYEAGLTYEGTWNASTNTPTLTSGQGVSGHFYIVNGAGNTNLDGNSDWHVGDWAVFFDAGGAGTAGWQKIDNTSVLTGSGTANTLAMWTATETLNDSLLSQDAGATKVIVDGLLEIKGDGTSQDGRIKLNCWNNNHGVTIQSPSHSAAQSWTWILPQTTGDANDVLTTDGNTPSQLSWTTPTTGTVTGTGTENYVTKWSAGGTGIEDSTIFDNGTNVGIGTDNPSSNLHVESAGNSEILAQRTSGAGVLIQAQSAAGVIGTSTNHRLDLKSNGTTRATISTNGNVGIGTSTPGSKLEVAGDILSTGDITIDNSTGDPFLKLKTNTQEYVIRIDQSDSDKFQIRDITHSLTPLTIDSSGNVGIGTSSPGYPLEVDGIIKTSTSFLGTTAVIQKVTALNANGIQFTDNGGSEKMRINPNGNVGIGTTSPAVSLDISATDAVQMPVGVTGDRPTTGVSNGMLRYNSSNNGFEGYINGNWGDIGGGSSGGLVFRGTFDASTGAIASGGSLYTCPAGGSGGTVDTAIGDLYIVTTAGSFFCSGTSLNVGDEVICITAATATNDNVNNWNAVASGAGGAVTGSGTTNYVPKFTGATVVGNSSIFNDASGNVGIGTASPSAKLHIQGADSINAFKITDSGNGDGFKVTSHTTQGTYVQAFDASHAQTIMLDARSDSTTRHTYFNGGGNVGIGTTNPDTKLHVESTSNADSPILTIENDNAKQIELGVVRSVAGIEPNTSFLAYDNDFRFIAGAGSTNEVMRIDSNGKVGIGTESPVVSLDLSFKNDAVSLPFGDNTTRPSTPVPGMIRYNSSANEFEGYSGVLNVSGSWGALGGGGTPTISKQLFQVTTATPTFVLNSPQVNPQDANYVNIFIDGVYQNSGTYTVATATGVTTVTLNTNAPVGTSVEIISTT
jgi:hypothetical protein